jgi:ribosomal protein S18 acetylase RimI-like enzyme
MLIRLYDLPAGRAAGPTPAGDARIVRKPIGTEFDAVGAWVGEHFGVRWASEARAALANRPVTLFVAVQAGEPIGFACYDATARGYVGPIGVLPQARGTGLGGALLRAALEDMRAAGYGYAVAGAVGASEFFRSVAGAVEIPGSSPGLYAGLVKTAP